MEKFSAWRDAGTGIQPFLPPVPPVQAIPFLSELYKPVGYIIGLARLILLTLVFAIYAIGAALSHLFTPIPPARRAIARLFAFLTCRIALVIIGFWWIPVEIVSRRKSRSGPEKWSPKAGDVIISNWASWIELLFLAFRVNPVFVIPVAAPPSLSTADTSGPPSSNVTPGRQTGTGSAAISAAGAATPPRAARSPILGFQRTSLLGMIGHTGKGPLSGQPGERYDSLDEIRATSDRPIVVFPECTSSNGRALLRFADVFEKGLTLPIRKFKIYVMCVRYDPPTASSPSMTHSVPRSLIGILPNPIPHLFTLLSAPTPARTMSVRLVSPDDSPSSGAFMAGDYITGNGIGENVTEACAGLVAYAGKLKRTTVLGWEDKVSFLDFYRSKL